MNAVSASEQAALTAPDQGAAPAPKADKWRTTKITWIRHWTPVLLSFRAARPEGFRFVPGHYVRLGLDDGVRRQ